MANDVTVKHVLTALDHIERWVHEVRFVLESLPSEQILKAPQPRAASESTTGGAERGPFFNPLANTCSINPPV